MKNKIITVVLLLILLVVSVYGYEMIFKKPLVESPSQESTVGALVDTLDVKTQYVDGMLTIAGTIQTPTPCHTVSTEVAQTGPESFDLTLTTSIPQGIICAQVISNKDFKVTFEAPATSTVKAAIDGLEYKLNMFEVPAGQDIDAFDLYIKG